MKPFKLIAAAVVALIGFNANAMDKNKQQEIICLGWGAITEQAVEYNRQGLTIEEQRWIGEQAQINLKHYEDVLQFAYSARGLHIPSVFAEAITLIPATVKEACLKEKWESANTR